MPRISQPRLTVFSNTVIEKDGTERLYVGAYIPETARGDQRRRVQECIGFLAVPNLDPTTYPQPRDGWVARPARENEETIENVITTVCGAEAYRHLTIPIARPTLEDLIGKAAIDPTQKAS